MTPEQAREILLRRRAGGDTDPEVQTALALAASDPALAEWLARQEAHSDQVRGVFAGIPTPPDLAASVLAHVQGRRRRELVRRREWLAAAAAAAALLAGGIGWSRLRSAPLDSFASYRERMVETALRGYRMDMLSPDPAAIRAYLKTHEGMADFRLPPGLATLPGLGCALKRWHDRPVTLVCLDGGAQGPLWLFITALGGLQGAPADGTRDWRSVSTLSTASWVEGGQVYLLAGRGGESGLRRRF